MTGLLGYHRHASASWLPVHIGSAPDALVIVPPREDDHFRPDAGNKQVQLEDWNRWTSEVFTELSTQLIEPTSFSGSIETVSRSTLMVSHIAAGPALVRRGKSEISHSAPGMLYLNIQLEGHGAVRHEHGETQLRVGDCILVDPRRPYVLEFLTDFRQLCVQMPEWLFVDALGAAHEDAVGKTVNLFGSFGNVLRAGLESLIQPPDELSSAALVDLFADVVGHHFRQALRQGKAELPGVADSTFMSRLRQLIARQFKDPDLSAVTAAGALGCSVRNVHKACQSHGTTFGRLLAETRLAAAARCLSREFDRGRRISSIAFACGFNDISHFGRAFRHRFGVSPSEFRLQI